MADVNALPDDPVTPDEAEQEDQTTDNQAEGETQPAKAETEAPAGTKNFQHAIQQAREREKKERAERERIEAELQDTKSRLEELELQGLSESERYRVAADKYAAEVQSLKEQIQVEDVKKEFRRVLADKESEYPKTVAFLKKQMDKDIYPVQGRDWEEFDTNFTDFAQEYEGVNPTVPPKPVASNPAYEPPTGVDLNTLNSKELRKLLPIAEIV